MRNLYLLLLVCTVTFASFAGDASEATMSFPKAEILNEHTTRIPFKLIDNLIVIEAELLDQKGNFIVDTGSETLILNKAHFKTRTPHNAKTRTTSGVLDVIDNPLSFDFPRIYLW